MLALLEQNQFAEAADRFLEALRLNPGLANIHRVLAIAQYREALWLQPDDPDVLKELAWILATDPHPELRSGHEAVRLAERACELTHHQQAAVLATLASAYAEMGQFSEAIAAAEKARDIALAAGQKEVAGKASRLLELFKSK